MKAALLLALVASTFLTPAVSFGIAAFCVTINDACCDGMRTSADYTVPHGQAIDTTHIFYSTPTDDKVFVECYFVNDGVETLVWSRDNLCGRGTIYVFDGHPIGQDHQLRFYVNCKQCTSNCTTGSSTVKIYCPGSK